ncbi:MAG: hypothetical protein WCX61_05800, partial [Candidatus Peribacteraceae bacterium]
MAHRPSFTLAEGLTVIAILAVLAGISVPLYRSSLIRNHLTLAQEQTMHVLRQAQTRAQAGDQKSAWGVHIPTGTLYAGTSYEERDSTYDEIYALPSSVTISGLTDISYSRLYGIPSTT